MSRPREFPPLIDDSPGFRRARFVRDYCERAYARARGVPVITNDRGDVLALEDLEREAEIIFDRQMAERQERLEARRYYRQVAVDDLRTLKKRLGPRKRITVTLPQRMAERISHIPAGLRSSTVTRLLARGWLWSEAFDLEVGEEE
jgi:hypothetical protein